MDESILLKERGTAFFLGESITFLISYRNKLNFFISQEKNYIKKNSVQLS